jgi:predicted MPP superfamily phosphohydrolase
MPLIPVFLFSIAFHAFVAWRLLEPVWQIAALYGTMFAGWLAVSALLMPLGMVSLRFARPPVNAALTWLGLLCMGLFSSLFSLTVLREFLVLATSLLHWASVLPEPAIALETFSAVLIAPVSVLMTMVGLRNARRTADVVEVEVPIANLPAALEGFSIAQISDIHIGPTIKTRYLERIVRRVNDLGADLVAITGDLVDGSVKSLAGHVAPLAELKSSYGTFFVTGNHEYYSGAQAWIEKLGTLGVRVLMNEHVVIDHPGQAADSAQARLVVAGVTDFSAHHFDSNHRSDPAAAMANAPEDTEFRLLLAHQPRSAVAAQRAGFDLQLSGHTHGGQFWPWGHFVRLQQPFVHGLHRLHNLWVYTSRGTGYWGPPKRLRAASEITHLRLVRAV